MILFKKNKYLAIQDAKLSTEGKINISLFCSVADISRDSYYQYLKHSKNQISDNNRYIEYISEVQDETGYGVGYRRMTAKINRKFETQIN